MSSILEDFDTPGRSHSAAGQSLSGRPPLSNIKRPSSTPPRSPAISPKVSMRKRSPYSKTPSPKPSTPQVNVQHPRFSGGAEDLAELVPKMLKTRLVSGGGAGRRTSMEGASKKKGGKKRGKGKKLRMSRQKSQDEKHKNFCFESNPEMCKRSSPRRKRKKKKWKASQKKKLKKKKLSWSSDNEADREHPIVAKIKAATSNDGDGFLDARNLDSGMDKFPIGAIIREFGKNPGKQLSKLHTINLNQNRLDSLPDTFFEWFRVDLEYLDLNVNMFMNFPKQMPSLTDLISLDIASNQLKSLGDVDISVMTNLSRLNLSDNQLDSLPGRLPPNLTVLRLSNNRLQEIPASVFRLEDLEDLTFKNNYLTQLPSGLAKLSNLVKLDLRSNKIEELPTEIFKDGLLELEKLRVGGNPLLIPPRFLLENTPWQNSVKVVRNFFQNEENSARAKVHWKRLSKAIFLGSSMCGKTSCARVLEGQGIDGCNSGAARESIGVRVSMISSNKLFEDGLAQNIVLWDMAGAKPEEYKEFQATHQLFLGSNRTLYVIVFDLYKFAECWLQKDKKKLAIFLNEHIIYWIKSVQDRVPDGKILLVANKLDQYPDNLDKRPQHLIYCIRQALLEKTEAAHKFLFQKIQNLKERNHSELEQHIEQLERIYQTEETWIGCLKDGKAIVSMTCREDNEQYFKTSSAFRSRIFQECDSLRKGQMNKLVPEVWVKIRDIVIKWENNQTPFVLVDEIENRLKDDDENYACDSEDITQALLFLNDCGEIVFFEPNIVFVSVVWIVGLLKQLLSNKGSDIEYNLSNDELKKRWNTYLTWNVLEDDSEDCKTRKKEVNFYILYRLMQQFNILFPCKVDKEASWLLCKIPMMDRFENGKSVERFNYPVHATDVEVSRIIQFERGGTVPHDLIHMIQAGWMESVGNDECKETHPYCSDAIILHIEGVQIYIQTGYNKPDGTEGLVDGSQYHNFLGIFIRHSERPPPIEETDNPIILHRYLNLTLQVIYGILSQNFSGLVWEVWVLCPMCSMTYKDISKMKQRQILSIYAHLNEENGEDIKLTCDCCHNDPFESLNRMVLQEDDDEFESDRGYENTSLHKNSNSKNHRKFDWNNIVKCPKPAIVSIGVCNATDPTHPLVYAGSGVCIDADKAIFLTCAHNFFETDACGGGVGSVLREKIRKIDFRIVIGLYRGDKQLTKWAFEADQELFEKFRVMRDKKKCSDDIFVLRAKIGYKDLRQKPFGHSSVNLDEGSEAAEKDKTEYLRATVDDTYTLDAQVSSRLSSLSLNLAGIPLVSDNDIVPNEVDVYGYPGQPKLNNQQAARTNALDGDMQDCLHNSTHDGRIFLDKCTIFDSSDDDYIYVSMMKHTKGASGGPALVKVPDKNGAFVHRVIGVFKGFESERDRALIVPSAKASRMINECQ